MAVDYQALKKGGVMRQTQAGYFSLRLRVIGGRLTAAQLQTITMVAEKYGHGFIHLTARQGVEIPFIKLENLEEVKTVLQAGGVELGVCGPRVRTLTACQGRDVCPNGAIATQTLAQRLDARYYGRELPHKFKIGISGCPNNCLKAEENDLGIKGGQRVSWLRERCSFCGLCAAVCPTGAIAIEGEEIRLDETRCNHCGKCVQSCPTGAWQGQSGYLLSFGGRFGTVVAPGRELLPLLCDEETVVRVVDATLDFYQKYGQRSERFGATLARVGEQALVAALQAVLAEDAARETAAGEEN